METVQSPSHASVQCTEIHASEFLSKHGRFVDSKFRTSLLAQILPSFKDIQTKIAEKAGFGFLWHLQLNYRPNRLLSAFLLLSIDISGSLICPSQRVQIPLRSVDACAIIGFDSGGSRPAEPCKTTEEASKHEVAKALSTGYPKISFSVARARSVLLALHDADVLSESEERAFLVALVIFTVASFIDPVTGVGNDINPRIIAALADPKFSGKLDWAHFAVTKLLESAEKTRAQIETLDKMKTINLNGCLPILNLLFIRWLFFSGQNPARTTNGPFVSNLSLQEIKLMEDEAMIEICRGRLSCKCTDLRQMPLTYLRSGQPGNKQEHKGISTDDQVQEPVKSSHSAERVNTPIIPLEEEDPPKDIEDDTRYSSEDKGIIFDKTPISRTANYIQAACSSENSGQMISTPDLFLPGEPIFDKTIHRDRA